MGVARSPRRGGRKPTNGNKVSGQGITYRSGLEADNGRFLSSHGIEVAFETIKIPYTVPESRHVYNPDFPLPNGIIVEVKGKFEPRDRFKHMFIKTQYPDLDIRFVFQRPHDKIRKGSPTTYAMWCDKHGFRWATRIIPIAWVNEKGPRRKPQEVLGL